jgi:4-hydroxybenzoate polyprenyltransferase
VHSDFANILQISYFYRKFKTFIMNLVLSLTFVFRLLFYVSVSSNLVVMLRESELADV